MGILKEFLDYTKTEKRKEKERQQLLNEKLDYDLLRKFLNELPSNPGLTLEIKLKSGDIITYKQESEQKEKDLNEGFDGQDYWRIQ